MNEELTLLAEAGAAAVVTAMATDLWQGTRDTVLGLFRRAEPGPGRGAGIEAQLDGNAALVEQTATPDDVRRALAAVWALELTALLRRDPSCRAPLARLTAEIDGALPNDLRRLVLEQTNTAHDSGTVYAVQRGDLHTHRPD
ncbi:hypothetical protein [Streptomyces sp. DSM 40750]|uniref:hypothetical protein n=1 Tax=Streptomyces sp. DSM 40750 TaxID=2801030 RepID=UPI00214BC837|nr:hypothetical protein [Streptomyces sp. DSM 40750]UUU23040.1 hypothetical protein JIX55_23630 [Streptomyces sp. DSM 40750]